MKGITGWQYRPYLPYHQKKCANLPYICRLAPSETALELEFLDSSALDAGHTLLLRPRGAEAFDAWEASVTPNPAPYDGWTMTAEGLAPDTDYEFCIRRDDGVTSRVRLARTGFYPDQVINYLHPDDEQYAHSGRFLCSPSIVRVPSGALVASMDLFAGAAPQNLQLILRSEDNGETWHYVCDLMPAYWGTLFVHRGVLYLLGNTTENGHLVIGASYDEGFTWTKPSLLFPGSALPTVQGWQREPMPIIEHNGYLRTSVDFGCWADPRRFGVGILSVPVDADLLEPANWTVSELTYPDRTWEGAPASWDCSYLEGSLYEAADGRLIDLLRITQGDVQTPMACVLAVDPDDVEAAPQFHAFLPMPTGPNSRTHILRDPVGGKYWALGCLQAYPGKQPNRNVMALSVSDDGYDWRLAKVVLDYSHLDPALVGFQYTSFLFDGDDILYLNRTAFNGADNYHNANCQTLGRIRDFRKLGE